jgi:hypothetical protein
MTDSPTADLLSGDEVKALKFAAHRQLARWANNPRFSPRQKHQRNALTRAVRTLGNQAFARGCELRVHRRDDMADA